MKFEKINGISTLSGQGYEEATQTFSRLIKTAFGVELETYGDIERVSDAIGVVYDDNGKIIKDDEEKRYSLNVRLKSGKEFNFTCSDYTINYNELSGCVTRFKFENGKGDCPVYLNPTDIESISLNNKEALV